MYSSDIREWLKEWRHSHDIDGNKLDSNGYGRSLLSHEDRCYLCGKGGDLARHEVYEGNNRKTSKAMGFWVLVCPDCHARYHAERPLAKALKRECQETFEKSHTHDDFMALIGRNYL